MAEVLGDQPTEMTPVNEIERELVDVWDAWAEAIIANDAARIGSFMTEDWIIVSQTGVTEREQFLSVVASGDLTHSSFARVGAPQVRVYGDTACMVVRLTNDGHYQGAPFSVDEWTSDVFLKRDGHWLCALSHITSAVEN